jgi:hypothetical protein
MNATTTRRPLTASETSARVAAMLSCPACTGEPGEPTIRPLTPARNPLSGRFVPAGHAAAVRQVALPGGRVGYQVGGGRIYAARRDALRFGLHRAARVELFNAALAIQYERSLEMEAN